MRTTALMFRISVCNFLIAFWSLHTTRTMLGFHCFKSEMPNPSGSQSGGGLNKDITYLFHVIGLTLSARLFYHVISKSTICIYRANSNFTSTTIYSTVLSQTGMIVPRCSRSFVEARTIHMRICGSGSCISSFVLVECISYCHLRTVLYQHH